MPSDLPAVVNAPDTAKPDRSKFIGGSDIAAILGISPWKTAVQLWQDKITPRVEDDSRPKKKVLSRGHRWESVVAEMLVEHLTSEGHAVEIVSHNQRYTDPEFPYFACEIDFEIRLDGEDEITNVELKTVHPFMSREWGDSGTDSAPVHYVAQAMWGMGITDRRRCLVAALFGADELKTYPVEYDAETASAMRSRASKFWNSHVLPQIAPPPADLVDMAVLFPTESDAAPMLADNALTAKVLRLRAIDKEIKARQAEFDSLEFEIKGAMRNCSELIVGEDTSAITWIQRAHTFLDQAALKEAHPKIVKEFTRKGTSRVFTLKQFGWKE